MKKKKLLICSFVLLILLWEKRIQAYPFENIIPVTENCDTSYQYNEMTRATIFGDSRIQYFLFTNPNNIDISLNAFNEGWNVQNFAVSGMRSYGWEPYADGQGLLGFLRKCYGQDPQKNSYSNFKIHQNVGFHIGGNDFIFSSSLLALMPWKIPTLAEISANNNERIISIFQRRGKNVLLFGHYPAKSNSAKLGTVKKYYTNTALGRQNAFRNNKEIYSTIVNTKYNECLASTTDFISPSKLQFYPVDVITLWTKSLNSYNTIVSIGLMLLESKIAEISQRRSRYFNLSYIHLWECFRLKVAMKDVPGFPSGTMEPVVVEEPYLADPSLLDDDVHPNATGLALWAKLVGNKMRALGWPSSDFSVTNQSFPKVDDDDCPEGANSASCETPKPPETNAGLPTCDLTCLFLLYICGTSGNCQHL